MIYVLEVATQRLVEAEIVPGHSVAAPLKKEGWNFNWRQLLREGDSKTFVLRLNEGAKQIQGVLHLCTAHEMLVMEVLEIAPHNVGRLSKKFDFVAGCLIAFACRESFIVEGAYKGFLTFVAKTELIDWYAAKYGAEQALGQRMFISPEVGLRLIEEYLNRPL